MSGNLTLDQNGATWVWGQSNVNNVEFRPVPGGSGTMQTYSMYHVDNSQWMWQTQGYTAAQATSFPYDIQRDTSNDFWSDLGGDAPGYFKLDSSTTAPAASSATVATTPQQATSTDKYLHMFTGGSIYMGYVDVWTPFHSSGSGSGGGNINPLSNSPKIENIVFTKTSDTDLSVSFDWENLDSFTFTNSRGGVIQTGTGSLSGSSGTVSTTFLPSIPCQEGDLCWIHGNYSSSSLEHHPTEYGSQSNPYVFKVVNFSVTGTTLTASTFLAGPTSLNNDADFRVWDFDIQSWNRLGYINYDGTLQTVTVTPFERGKAYYVVDRSTGNDYGTRYLAPGTGRRTRGRTFW